MLVDVCEKGYSEIVDLLLHYRPRLISIGWMALIAAVRNVDLHIATSLLESGAGPKAFDHQGRTLLEVARDAISSQGSNAASTATAEDDKGGSRIMTQWPGLSRLEDLVRGKELERATEYAWKKNGTVVGSLQSEVLSETYLKEESLASAQPSSLQYPDLQTYPSREIPRS